MKYLKFFFIGILFGIILSKSEAISWFRIYEMFKFQSFHMYGLIATAVTISMFFIYLFKKEVIKDYQGNTILIKNKEKGYIRTLAGGFIFGLGWALAGACPGPIFVMIGYSVFPILIVLVGAILGTFIYGILSNILPK